MLLLHQFSFRPDFSFSQTVRQATLGGLLPQWRDFLGRPPRESLSASGASSFLRFPSTSTSGAVKDPHTTRCV